MRGSSRVVSKLAARRATFATLLLLAIVTAFLLAACSPTRYSTGEAPSAAGTTGVSPGAAAEPGAATAVAEPWRTATLVDARSGEEFRIADLEGKLVAIETMAIWCANCRVQQHEVRAALDALDRSDIVYLSLDVDPNERASDLAEYARREGFDWRFAVASPKVARALADSFGDQVLSPPATPLVLLAPDGRIVDQHFGIRAADQLTALFEEHLS